MPPSQAQRLSHKIEEEILTSRLKPGDKLDENRLAEKFGTSRTPVREALRQLSSNGLVELRPHKGAIVAKMGVRELAELFEVMAELEGACGKLAAKSCLRSDLEAIIAAQEKCRRAADTGDAAAYQSGNEAFHECIYRASHNGCLLKLTLSIRNRVAPYRRWLVHARCRLKEAAQDHERIAHAIENRLANEADRLLQQHIFKNHGEAARLVSMLSGNEMEVITTGGGIRIAEPVSAKRR
jgi:DNA-binding GntR family transcriptional regulator